jgi:lipoprotein-releasing system permease protein
MIGVAALIVVLSIFNAFQNIAIKQIVGFDPHIKIEKIIQKNEFENFRRNILEKNQYIERQAFISEFRIICFKNGLSRTANLYSSDKSNFSYFSNFESNLIIGNMKLNGNRTIPSVVIGAGLADAMRTLPGDTLFLTTASEIENSILSNSLPETQKAIVNGIFQTNVKDYDYNFIFGNFDLSRILLKNKFDKSMVYQIRIKKLNELDDFYEKLKFEMSNSGIKSHITNWKELNKEYYNVMKFEKMSTSFILGLIILVAIFNVFASLTMTIIEKKKDISILRAVGGSGKFIQRIYLYEGLFVGFIGSIFGGLLGLALCYGQIAFKWFKIDNTKYIMDAIPILINYSDVIAVVLLSFVLSIIATIYPAWKSSKINLIESLREE